MNQLLSYFEFPKESLLHEKIQVNVILNQIELQTLDRKGMNIAIQSVHLEALLDKNTTRILEYIDDVYRYEAIVVLGVILADNRNFSFINEKIHQAFQNPVIALYKYRDSYYISCSMKRLNKLDVDKTVIDEIITTDNFLINEEQKPFLLDLDFRKFESRNLKQILDILSAKLIKEQIIKITNNYPKGSPEIQFVRNSLKEYSSIKMMTRLLEDQYKKETMMSKKMDIHIMILDNRSKLKEIETNLKKENYNG